MQLPLVHLVESHRVEGGLTEEHTFDGFRVAAGKVGHPCRRRRVRACGFRLVASVTADLVTFYQTVSAGIGKADVIAVKIPVPSVPYEKNEWGKLSDRFIGYSTLAEDQRNALHVYLPHFIA